jgi:hypothetical protein
MCEFHGQKSSLQYTVLYLLFIYFLIYFTKVEEKTLDPFVNLSDDVSVLVVNVTLPQSGQYGLDLYARPKSAAEASTLSHACKYLINAKVR